MSQQPLKGRERLAACKDFIHLAVCMTIHPVVNGRQFTDCEPSDFVNFLNLKPTHDEVVAYNREGLRIGYLAECIGETIQSRKIRDQWIRDFLKQCNVSQSNYKNHSTEITGNDASEVNKRFRKRVDEAIKEALTLQGFR